MTTICVLGAGELGGAAAHALARGERVARILLVDAAGSVAAGKALDIQQSGAIEGFHTRLDGTDDVTRVTGCSACIVADPAGTRGREWQDDEGLAMLARVLPFTGKAPIVFAGAAQASLLRAAVRELGLRPARAMGSAAEAFAGAVTAMVAMEARCAPAEVRLAVLGAPGSGLVVAWSEASIGGYALERVLTQVQLARLEARAARLWPPGPLALGQSAAQVAAGLLGSARRAFHLLTMLDGEFGVRGRVGVLPALLAPSGIVRTRVPTLNTRERVLVETALDA